MEQDLLQGEQEEDNESERDVQHKDDDSVEGGEPTAGPLCEKPAIKERKCSQQRHGVQ